MKKCHEIGRKLLYKFAETETNNAWSNAELLYYQKDYSKFGELSNAMTIDNNNKPDFGTKFSCKLEYFSNGKYQCPHNKENNVCRRHTQKNFRRRGGRYNGFRGRGRGRQNSRNSNNNINNTPKNDKNK